MDKFQKDDIVEIISMYNSLHKIEKVVGYTKPGWSGFRYVGVRLVDTNIYLNYNENSLKLVNKNAKNKGDNIMTGNFKVARVNFLNGVNTTKEYTFALFDENVSIGDIVVCDTAYGFNLGRVVSINNKNETNSNKVTKEIVCRVDMSNFQQRKENRERIAKLKNMMEQRIKELQDITLFEMMAKKDDKLKGMLDEYKVLASQSV